MQKTPCCIKKFAVTEVDPCGGVEKQGFGMKLINMFVHEEEVSLCRPVPFGTHRILSDYDTLHCCDIRITCI